MISRISLSTFAALAIAGVGGGIYLGKAAVSDINPLYFSEPPTRFHGDLVPHRPSEATNYRAGELSAANLDQALGGGCIGCRTYPEEMVLVHRGTTGKADIGYAEVTSAPIQAVAYEQDPAVEFASVERYTNYPVAQEPTPAVEALPQTEVAAIEPTEPEPIE